LATFAASSGKSTFMVSVVFARAAGALARSRTAPHCLQVGKRLSSPPMEENWVPHLGQRKRSFRDVGRTRSTASVVR